MAFLCPSGFGRLKHKKGYGSLAGRLTRSDSIDTVTLDDLVELSYSTPESRRIVLQSFHACAPQEVTVKQGQKVNFIYKESDWAYVTTDDRKEGFIPFSYCAKLGVPSQSLSSSRSASTSSTPESNGSRRTLHSYVDSRKVTIESDGTRSNSCASDVADDLSRPNEYSFDSETDDNSEVNVRSYESPLTDSRSRTGSGNIQSLSQADLRSSAGSDMSEQPKCDISNDDDQESILTGIYSVLHDYTGKDAYDISVHADDIVFVLDARDPDWFWVQKPDGSQGYVPKNFLEPVEKDDKTTASMHGQNRTSRPASNHVSQKNSVNDSKTGKLSCRQSNTSDKTPRMTFVNGDNLNSRSNECMDSVENKKKSPQKPPRAKKSGQSLTPRSIGSCDSMDTSLSSFDAFGSLDDLEVSCRVHTPTEMSSACSTPRQNNESFKRLQQVTMKHRNSKQNSKHDSTDSKSHLKKYSRASSSGKHSIEGSQRRPFSLPVFKSFDEYQRDHYDQYFYEDRDTEFGKHTNRSVVNVEEILRIRSEREQQRKNEIRKRERSKESETVPKKATNLRDFLQNMNKAKMEASTANKVENQIATTSTDRSALQPVKTNTVMEDSVKIPEDCNMFGHYKRHQTNAHVTNDITRLTGDVRKFSSTHNLASMQDADDKIELRPRSNSHGQNRVETEESQPGCSNFMKTDWSFGYPRKAKYNEQFKSTDNAVNAYSRIEHNDKSNNPFQVKNTNSIVKNDTSNKQKTENNSSQGSDRTDRSANQNLKTGQKHQYNENNFQHNNKCTVDKAELICVQENESSGARVHGRSVDGVTDVLRYLDEVCDAGDDKSDTSEDDVDNDSEADAAVSRTYDEHTQNDRVDPEKVKLEIFMNRFDYQTLDLDEDEGSNSSDDKYQMFHDVGGEDNTTDLYKEEYENSEPVDDAGDMDEHEEGHDECDNKDDMFDNTYTVDDKCAEYHEEEDDDDDMEELLRRTEELMHWTGELLDGHCNHNDYPMSASYTGKCVQFLCNQTIGTNGVDHNCNQMKNIDQTMVLIEECNHNENQSSIFDHSDKDINISKVQTKLDIGDIRGITEFIAQRDYKPRADDELPIMLGEIVHVDLNGQKSEALYWAFSPRLRKYGFVPSKHLKIPLITII